MTAPEVRSFDPPRDREAPDVIEGHWLDGERASMRLTGLTLVVAIKNNCDGCREFVESELSELAGVTVVLVSAAEDTEGEWSKARHPVLVAPALLQRLEVRWPPFYVLIDAVRRRVLTEGVVFAPSQVADEIERYLHH